MAKLIKVQCCTCGVSYFVKDSDMDFEIPRDLAEDDALPIECPFCERGYYATVLH